MKKASVIGTAIVAAGFSTVLQAESLVLGAGSISVFDSDPKLLLQLGYQAEPIESWFGLQPTAGLLASEQSTVYISLGLQKQFTLSDRWDWGLGLDGGYYHSNAHDLDLDYDLIFRSHLFVDYQLNPDAQLRLELGHMSNANLGDENPGTETLLLSWVRAL